MSYEMHNENIWTELDDLRQENRILRKNIYDLQDQYQAALKRIAELLDAVAIYHISYKPTNILPTCESKVVLATK